MVGDVEMEGRDRENQRRHGFGVRQIDVGAAGEQALDALEATAASGVQQRREAAVVHVLRSAFGRDAPLPGAHGAARIDVGACADQEIDHVGLELGGRPHQRRLPAPCLGRVDVCARVEQQLGRRRRCRYARPIAEPSRLRGSRHSHRRPPSSSSLMSAASPMAAASAIAVAPYMLARGHVGAGVEQHCDELGVAAVRGPHAAASCRRIPRHRHPRLALRAARRPLWSAAFTASMSGVVGPTAARTASASSVATNRLVIDILRSDFAQVAGAVADGSRWARPHARAA